MPVPLALGPGDTSPGVTPSAPAVVTPALRPGDSVGPASEYESIVLSPAGPGAVPRSSAPLRRMIKKAGA